MAQRKYELYESAIFTFIFGENSIFSFIYFFFSLFGISSLLSSYLYLLLVLLNSRTVWVPASTPSLRSFRMIGRLSRKKQQRQQQQKKSKKKQEKHLPNSFLRTENSLTKKRGRIFLNCLYACVFFFANAALCRCKTNNHLKAKKNIYTHNRVDKRVITINYACLAKRTFFKKKEKNSEEYQFFFLFLFDALLILLDVKMRHKANKTDIILGIFLDHSQNQQLCYRRGKRERKKRFVFSNI